MSILNALGFVSKQEYARVAIENAQLRNRVNDLVTLCNEKDSFFKEVIADGLRHGSSLSAKHMSDLNKYLNGK